MFGTTSSRGTRLPWFIRVVDRFVDRHEQRVTGMRSSPRFYEELVRYATTGDAEARAWVAEALSRYDYFFASRVWVFALIAILLFGFLSLMATSLRGCGVMLLLLLLVPVLVRFDRWNRRRKAWNNLAIGKAWIYEKVEVRPPREGSRIFQSDWTRGDIDGRVELDHPMELWEAVQEANEWWQWEMPMPHEQGGRVAWMNVFTDVGLVHRDDRGRRRLLASGVVYFSYDPWTQRIDTGTYE